MKRTITAVAAAVVKAVAPLPVTGKIRIGWDADSINAIRIASILSDQGIAAITVHGGTSSWQFH